MTSYTSCLLLVCVGMFLWFVPEVQCDHGESHYCTASYIAYETRYRCGYRYWRWWGGWRCCYYVPYSVPVTRYNTKACCPSYKGALCNIPICNSPVCLNSAVCTAPNTCYCRPGTGGNACGKLDFCTAQNDCYPGTCNAITKSCSCASGYDGNSCQQLLEGGTFHYCNAYLDDKINGQQKRNLIGKCASGEDTANYTYYSNILTPTNLVMDYEVRYINNKDLPALPTEYMSEARFGLFKSYVNIKMFTDVNISIYDKDMECNIRVAAGQSPPSQSNPHQTLQCMNITKAWGTRVGQRYRLELQVFSQSGGFKKFITSTNQIITRNYIGTSSSQKVSILFDIERPTHCSKTASCEDAKNDYPSTWMPDVAKDNNISVLWFSWNDTDSGIKGYHYTIYAMYMNTVSGKLVMDNSPIYELTWKPNLDFNRVVLPNPGMFSMVLEISDVAGNVAKTRSLVLYHDSTPIEIQEANPIVITDAESWDSAYWITQPSNAPIIITWKNRFINKFIHNNKLLAAVEPLPNTVKEGIIDDHTGNRTVNEIPNVQGVVQFNVTHNIGLSGAISTTPTRPWINNDLKEGYNITEPRGDGQTIIVFIRAFDVFGEIKEESVPIHIDSTKAVYTTILLKPNSAQFSSALDMTAVDSNSGIREIIYSLIDTTYSSEVVVYTDTVPGQKSTKYKTKDECVASQGECYCVPVGPCYNTVQVINIDNCKIKDLQGHDFRLNFTVVNGAGLFTSGDYKIGILKDLNGIGYYPPVEDTRVIDANTFGTKATIAWTYQKSCYPVTGLRLTFSDSKSTRELQVQSDQKTHELKQLHPRTEYRVEVIVVYEGGAGSTAATVTFTTADLQPGEYYSGAGIGTVTIIGIVIGIIVLVLLIVIIAILLIRRKQHKPMVPPVVRDTTSRIWNRLSRFHPAPQDNNMDPEPGLKSLEHRVGYSNNAYSEPNKESNLIGAARKKNMELNVAYIGAGGGDVDDEDDVYIYGNMDTDPDAQWKVSNDRIIIGGSLPNAKGRFADIKMASLQDKNGKTTVVAKMNKIGAREDERLLMMAKMNFLATGIPRHENIVNFVAAVPPPNGPIILTEYCEEGKLLDWLKAQGKITDDIEDMFVSFSTQIASGMHHLHENKILHRRLGARNVLLKATSTNQLVAKVTGFGPMKGEQEGTETINKKEKVPLKWMAPEQFDVPHGKSRKYTPETDIWSYGITLHEIYSKGEAPYADMKSSDYKTQVRNGYRMPKCDYCPDFIYDQVMMPCWVDKPDQRPDFSTIVTGMKHYFDGEGIQEGYYYDQQTQTYGNYNA